MENVYDILKERGFIEQCTNDDALRDLLGKEKITFYTGFDPTADSLHVGHFIPLMVMKHMQNAGHRPIALMGGGTGMVGDPTGRTDMRRVMTINEIDSNVECFKKQISRFIDFSDDKALIVNNADWLRHLNYVDLLREVGACFSVNRMLSYDCFKTRWERGLSFIEFNYMIMQSYDFLHLNRTYDCRLQLGGNDQWSNIISGIDLVRRLESKEVFGLTVTLLTNSEGKKMGKTAGGAVWLDGNKMSPYDFYQYWRNVNDADVEKCLSLLTFVPMDEVRRLSALEGAQINTAKEVLAYEVTKLIHGEEKAAEAQKAARALFAGADQGGSIPTTVMNENDFASGMEIIPLLQQVQLIKTTSEGRRIIEQGGLTVGEKKISDIKYLVTLNDFADDQLLIKKGKKSFHLVKLAK